VTLRWAVPTERNGILTGYIVGYRRGQRPSDNDFYHHHHHHTTTTTTTFDLTVHFHSYPRLGNFPQKWIFLRQDFLFDGCPCCHPANSVKAIIIIIIIIIIICYTYIHAYSFVQNATNNDKKHIH